jgi:hypothetical protein
MSKKQNSKQVFEYLTQLHNTKAEDVEVNFSLSNKFMKKSARRFARAKALADT